MAAESNAGFHHEEALGSALARHAINFQTGAINSTSEMIPMGNYFSVNNSNGITFSGNSNTINSGSTLMTKPGNSAGSLLLDSVPGLKHDVGLAVEWSLEEQYKLEEGLVKYADEPSIMRYIKIAATLGDKTVRDVALRCRWMTKKRRKHEEHNAGKKVNSRKDKLVDSSSKMNIPSAQALNMTGYPIMHHGDRSEQMPCDGISGAAKRMLEQNLQAFGQISANLSSYKLQENIDLFCRTRNNINAILIEMRNMPGIMSHMPRLPVVINEDLAKTVLPNATW